MLSRDFTKLLTISFVISCSVVYWLISRWLENFTHKIDIPWWLFLLAELLVATVALLATSYQTIKAASANPVDSLRSE